jgi:hypothetical protein
MVDQKRKGHGGCIGFAVAWMLSGKKVAREGWNGKGMWVALQRPDEGSMNRQPYVYIVPVGGERVPWVCSQADLLAADWFIVE